MESVKSSKATIIEVRRQGGSNRRIGPIVVDFSHAKLRPESVNDFNPPKVDYNFNSSQQNEIPNGAIPNFNVELQYENLMYSSNASSVRQINKAYKYQREFFAVRNKKTNKIRLIEVNNVTLGAITTPPSSTNPVLIEDLLKQHNEATENNNLPDSEKKKIDARNAMNKSLVREFGQTKGRRIYDQNDRMQINPDVLQEKLNKAALSVEAPSMDNSNPSTDAVSTLLPPCNRDATEVELVYSLENGILSQSEIAKLQSAATSLSEEYNSEALIKTGVGNKEFSEYFGKILIREYKEIDSMSLAVAIYMEAIIRFIDIKGRNFNKGPRGMPSFIPLELREKVFRVFTNDKNNIVPTTRDSAICYVIILALMINKYRIELSDLTSSIRVKVDHLKKLIKVTGARILPDVNRTYVQLKLPLENFDPSVQMKRKGSSQRGGLSLK